MAERRTTVAVDISWTPDVVWNWTTDLRNVNAICAPFLGLRYDLSEPPWFKRNFVLPIQTTLLGIPVTEVELRITAWQPYQRFVDEGWRNGRQVWEHTHIYTPLQRGTRYTDSIRLQVGGPGVLSDAVVSMFFKHRQRKLRRLITLD